MISWTKNRNLQAAKNSAGKEEGDMRERTPSSGGKTLCGCPRSLYKEKAGGII